ncbi:MAG: hypothetical protein R2838_10605 [Caldilineaceae bacterium]
MRSYAPIPAIKAIIGQRGDPGARCTRRWSPWTARPQELFSAMGVESGVAS